MVAVRTLSLSKILAVVLCLFIAFEVQASFAGQGAPSDPLSEGFVKAKNLYFAGDYAGARPVLEGLLKLMAAEQGRDLLKGEIYLLAGADYEMLKLKEPSVACFCKAKELLGEGNAAIEGLDLSKFAFYKEKCEAGGTAAGPSQEPRTKGKLGRVILTVLVIAAAGGLIWYLFFSKQAPFRKRGTYTKVTFDLSVRYRGFNSTGRRKLTVAGVERLNETFTYPQALVGDECNQATKEEDYTYRITVDADNFVIQQDYIDWAFYGSGGKRLCHDYAVDVVEYEYADGRDPGKPDVEGLDGLVMNVDLDCHATSGGMHDCTKSATVRFVKAAGASGRSSVSGSTSR